VRFSSARRRLRFHDLTSSKTAESLVDRSDRVVGLEGTGERHDGPRRRVTALHELAQAIRRHPEHDLFASGHFPAQRVSRVQELVDERVHPVLGLVAIHAQLFDDHVAF